ncbi:MAG: BlaI/MecI/CopY family transcriptional regulator [Lachnospiraceae bacterium]|nr:BlaI/MecI/CopY family transcriptional regulator [Lachnospiraceae bacterium]
MKKQEKLRKLSACETLIMKLIWDSNGDIAVQDLIVRMRERYEKDYARTTMVTFLKKLSDKGYVRTYRVGRTSYVHAEKSEEQYKQQMLSEETDFWFGGKPSRLVSALCNSQKISEDEIRSIRELLDDLDD